MTESRVYNIPAGMVEAYRGQDIIVRAVDPVKIIQRLSRNDIPRTAYIQIPVTGAAIDCLLRWEHPVPVDLVVQDPEAELPMLYHYAPLTARRPVRVSVRCAAGFGKVVKLALSLDFAVKLNLSQPEPALIDELLQVADLYLHHVTVSQPVEFIHSIFWGFYHKNPVTLWSIQEEDPAHFCHVDDPGETILSPHRAVASLTNGDASFIKEYTDELRGEKQDCCDCAFFDNCAGYFKWPRRDYRCDGVKTLFQTLRDAAVDLRADIAASGLQALENGS